MSSSVISGLSAEVQLGCAVGWREGRDGVECSSKAQPRMKPQLAKAQARGKWGMSLRRSTGHANRARRATEPITEGQSGAAVRVKPEGNTRNPLV
jgi:hypothetical protein